MKISLYFTKSNITVCASIVRWFYLPIPYSNPLVFKNLIIPLILTHHTYRLTRTFSQSDVRIYRIWLVEYFACQYWFIFLWHIPDLPSFLHFYFWFIICLLFFAISRSCLCALEVSCYNSYSYLGILTCLLEP